MLPMLHDRMQTMLANLQAVRVNPTRLLSHSHPSLLGSLTASIWSAAKCV